MKRIRRLHPDGWQGTAARPARPNLSENEANTIRLNELERQANKLFDDEVSIYDGTTYRYSIESIGTEADTALKCHYVNVRILFEVLNVK